jgi:hypothetical protein
MIDRRRILKWYLGWQLGKQKRRTFWFFPKTMSTPDPVHIHNESRCCTNAPHEYRSAGFAHQPDWHWMNRAMGYSNWSSAHYQLHRIGSCHSVTVRCISFVIFNESASQGASCKSWQNFWATQQPLRFVPGHVSFVPTALALVTPSIPLIFKGNQHSICRTNKQISCDVKSKHRLPSH